jgi:hypothetical protein
MFVAFATLYPGAVMIFNILAQWWAIVAVGIYSLEDLAHHDFGSLASLWATVSFAFGFVRYQQGRWSFPKFKSRPRSNHPAPKRDSSLSDLDPILDKISQSGFSSLTVAERAKLDAGRAKLAKRQAKDRDRG